MHSPARAVARAVAVATLAVCAAVMPASQAQQPRITALSIAPDTVAELRQSDDVIDRLSRAGELRRRRVQEDTLLPDREHERFDQFHHGVRVWGGDVVRQLRTDGRVVSTFGTVYEGIDLVPSPRIDEEAATAALRSHAGADVALAEGPELVVLPRENEGYLLTWRLRVTSTADVREYFIDASSGRIAFDYSDLQTQTPVIGRGTGVLGDQKKVSVRTGAGGYIANDALRPPVSLITYDLKGDVLRTSDYVNGRIGLGTSDIAFDADNNWTDGAVTDAHVYTGYTYDYFYKRFNRRGLNDANLVTRTIVNPADRNDTAARERYPIFFNNAAYFGGGLIIYGVGLPSGVASSGRTWDHASGAIDIVAHELTHGVTDYTSDLFYFDEPGALNEAFSDMMATAVEFFWQPAGSGNLRADYLAGEDAVKPAGIRSLQDPRAYGYPDHYSIRYTGSADNGGVHINSSIPNHAFYLAIEGGTNRTSGVGVQGVGAANREQIERIFYRAFTTMLPRTATFSMARAATIQAAQDLYGANSAAERAVTEAWTAVGVE